MQNNTAPLTDSIYPSNALLSYHTNKLIISYLSGYLLVPYPMYEGSCAQVSEKPNRDLYVRYMAYRLNRKDLTLNTLDKAIKDYNASIMASVNKSIVSNNDDLPQTDTIVPLVPFAKQEEEVKAPGNSYLDDALSVYTNIIKAELRSKSTKIVFNLVPDNYYISIYNNNIDVTITNAAIINALRDLFYLSLDKL